MPRDTAPTDATNPVFAYLIIFGTSLIGAAVLYGGLKSTGVFESEGMELGGAAAGFVIILLIAKRIFSPYSANIWTTPRTIRHGKSRHCARNWKSFAQVSSPNSNAPRALN
ncbi:hypothetical protein [Porticoccus sp.]|nr:MAG: hypothetical protein EP324_05620 [Gammaproteobacteria bacterium]